MRISDWSSDVCSSDMRARGPAELADRLASDAIGGERGGRGGAGGAGADDQDVGIEAGFSGHAFPPCVSMPTGRNPVPRADWDRKAARLWRAPPDRKSTRLNSSH